MPRHNRSTSCRGFGANYNEDLMTTMAQVSGGQFYDADAPERFPATAPPMIIKPIQSISARMRTSISGGKAGRQEPDAFAAPIS